VIDLKKDFENNKKNPSLDEQDNIKEMRSLKESNIEKFKKVFSNQINCINKEIQEDITRNIDKVIKMLDLFFLDREEIDSKQEEEFRKKVEENRKNLKTLINTSDSYLDSLKDELKNKISKSLEEKKENLEELLKSKNSQEILSEINMEILYNSKQLNAKILSYLKT